MCCLPQNRIDNLNWTYKQKLDKHIIYAKFHTMNTSWCERMVIERSHFVVESPSSKINVSSRNCSMRHSFKLRFIWLASFYRESGWTVNSADIILMHYCKSVSKLTIIMILYRSIHNIYEIIILCDRNTLHIITLILVERKNHCNLS